MKKYLVIALTLSVFFIGCKKHNSTDPTPTPSPTEVVIAKEVKVISNQTWIDNIIS